MALIKCPECGKDFSDKAASCPNCGLPITDEIRAEGLKNLKIPDTDTISEEELKKREYDRATEEKRERAQKALEIGTRQGNEQKKSINKALTTLLLLFLAFFIFKGCFGFSDTTDREIYTKAISRAKVDYSGFEPIYYSDIPSSNRSKAVVKINNNTWESVAIGHRFGQPAVYGYRIEKNGNSWKITEINILGN